MKKLFLTLVTVFFFTQFSKAQTQVGAGILVGAYNATAIEAKANFNVSDDIDISPSFDYFLINSNYDFSIFMLSADGHYNFDAGDQFTVYPLIGLNYLSISGNGYSYSDGIGLNVGGGASYGISDNLKLYAEAKYVRTGFGLSAGVLFSL
jgi:opacity protein-like surface antigen